MIERNATAKTFFVWTVIPTLPGFALIGVLLLFCAEIVSSEQAPFKTPSHITKLLESYCFNCHDGDLKKGDIRLDNLHTVVFDKRIELLNKVQEQLFSEEMPPKKKDQPSSAERDSLLTWVASELKKYNASKLEDKLRYYKYGNYVSHEKLFNGEIKDKPFSPARRWRINEMIYYELINDVFQLKDRKRLDSFYGIVKPFNLPTESGVKYYDTEVVEGGVFLTLLANAKWVVGKQLRAGLIKNGQYTFPEGYDENAKGQDLGKRNKLYPDEAWTIGQTAKEFEQIIATKGMPSAADLEAAINCQFNLALQRLPTKAELTRYLQFMQETIKIGTNAKALEKMMVSVLMEPDFVYRSEFGDGKTDAFGRMTLSPREASYAIAYALTDNVPDQQLVQAANSGKLSTPDDYKREVTRLLADDKIAKPRLLRFFQDYFGYLGIYNVFKDEERFVGAYNPHRVVAAVYHYRVPGKVSQEADLLVNYILKQDKDVLKQLLTTDKFFVHHTGNNEEMAKASEKASEFEQRQRDVYKTLIGKTGKELNQAMSEAREKEKAAKSGVNVDGNNLNWFKNMFGEDGAFGLDRKTMPRFPEHVHHSVKMYNIDYRTWSYEPNQPMKIDNRMGILTHPAWLVSFSKNAHTDPVVRGKWIREKLLAGFVPDVPITVDAKVPEDPHRTLRERFSVTEKKECWHCHQKMNPLGYAFESYDDFGRFRTDEEIEYPENIIKKEKVLARTMFGTEGFFEVSYYKTKPVDPRGVLDGTGDKSLDGEVTNAQDLITRLAHSDRVRQSFIRNVFRYFMGRNEMLSDSQTLIAADKAYVESGGSFNALVISLLTSDSFIYRKDIKD